MCNFVHGVALCLVVCRQQPPLPRERLAQLGVNSPHQLLSMRLFSHSHSLTHTLPLRAIYHSLCTAKTGDIVLCHYQLAHAIAPNMSPNIRYMVYFRVSHVNHPYFQFRPESMDNVRLSLFLALSLFLVVFNSLLDRFLLR
jgi:hypothetical protein